MAKIDPKDGGYRSRKFWAAVLGMAMVCVMAYLSESRVTLAGLYPTLVGGIVGILGAYYTGNVATKLVASKQQAIEEEPVEQSPES